MEVIQLNAKINEFTRVQNQLRLELRKKDEMMQTEISNRDRLALQQQQQQARLTQQYTEKHNQLSNQLKEAQDAVNRMKGEFAAERKGLQNMIAELKLQRKFTSNCSSKFKQVVVCQRREITT